MNQYLPENHNSRRVHAQYVADQRERKLDLLTMNAAALVIIAIGVFCWLTF